MFCYQCEQTAIGGCKVVGVCGKNEDLASIQDTIIFALPELKKYPHLKGNIGKAWYDQRKFFEKFPGAILATTNCVMPIKGTYSDQFFSYEVAGLEGVTKIENNDFTPIIEKALHLPSANIDSDQKLVTGYHHETVIGLAPEIISLLAKNV